jgi:ribonuclease T1
MGLKQIRVVSKAGAWAMAALLAMSAGTFLVQARAPVDVSPLSRSGLAKVALAGLPSQGQEVMARIYDGGPFRYEKDGTVFGNRERLLPSQTRGYYREYTVPTPGLSQRGARRIVCGGQQLRQPDVCFYTEDHYSSFRLIVQ